MGEVSHIEKCMAIRVDAACLLEEGMYVIIVIFMDHLDAYVCPTV